MRDAGREKDGHHLRGGVHLKFHHASRITY